MKMRNILGLAIAIGLMQPLFSNAQDVYVFPISWRGTVRYDDGTGRMVTKSYTDKDAVKTIADHTGLDPKDLMLVYRPATFDTWVYTKAGERVADYIQLPDITRVGTTWMTDVTGNGQTSRQAFIFDEQENPIGSIIGTEKQKRDADNNIESESFHGTFQIAIPDGSHVLLAQGVYSGTFAAGGRRIKDITPP